MTRNEALLVQIAEEAAEVSQAASKCLRFGVEDTHAPLIGKANERLYQELLELTALVEMAQAAGLLPGASNAAGQSLEDGIKIQAKKDKVAKYLQISQDLGTVNG